MLNRELEEGEPGNVFVTDITYLPNRSGKMVHLSCVKDVTSHELVDYEVTTSLSMKIIYRTFKKLKEALGEVLIRKRTEGVRAFITRLRM